MKQKLYNSKAWHRLRMAQLRDYPLCEFCRQQGRIEKAEIVDHIKPHRGNKELFYDVSNLQSLCKQHHDSAKQAAENRGVEAIGCGADGQPIDPQHHWNKG